MEKIWNLKKKMKQEFVFGGKSMKKHFWKSQQIKNEKKSWEKNKKEKKVERKPYKLNWAPSSKSGWIEPPSSKLQNWNSNKNKQKVEMGKERNEEEGNTNLDKESSHLQKSNETREQRSNKGKQQRYLKWFERATEQGHSKGRCEATEQPRKKERKKGIAK